MGYVVKLIKGKREFDLQANGFSVSNNFTPPTTQTAPIISKRRDAIAIVDLEREQREFSFGVHIEGSSGAEANRMVRRLQQFLGLAGDENIPLYLA